MIETAEHALEAATQATQDTVTVAIEGYVAAPKGETILFNMLSGFVGGFALMRRFDLGHPQRLVADQQREGSRAARAPLRPRDPDRVCRRRRGSDHAERQLEQALALPFGAGIGLTFDEAALLLELDDVYWSREGLFSVQLSLGTTGLLAATLLALRICDAASASPSRRG